MAGQDVLEALRRRFPEGVLESSTAFGDATVVISRQALLDVVDVLRRPPYAFALLLDVTCVDEPARAERFELVYHLYSFATNDRLRVKCRIAADDAVVASLTPFWKNADWLEREVFDMFGVRFSGHPDLRRLFMNEEFEGHPLRKDYPLRKRQPLLPLRK